MVVILPSNDTLEIMSFYDTIDFSDFLNDKNLDKVELLKNLISDIEAEEWLEGKAIIKLDVLTFLVNNFPTHPSSIAFLKKFKTR